ncbi:hypothetical protein [Candidatus Wolbachia massiliensis]|uniref:Uncharacterized protein n=1 Tax=Candidatus Wolbachia massiliensis TaxID=1845000 RepID=A0A7L7YLN8_9RICK|nr:hypothetical protein [Candidatus Wolbachia massiliensis]QOD38170.1 hypothetical protein ID128_05200 [Candidatus Wolbachia massiliensis]
MWENIKKFFKWIADHTGISWILGKISSGWKSCWSSSQEDGFVKEQKVLEQPANGKQSQEPVIAGIQEEEGKLVLFVESNNISKIFGGSVGLKGNTGLNTTEIKDKLKYRVYIRCDEKVFKVTFSELIDVNSRGAFLSIESVAPQDGQASSSELEGMKNMLGLSEKQAVIAVTQISKDPITVPKTVENGNTPNPKTNNPQAQQHTGPSVQH